MYQKDFEFQSNDRDITTRIDSATIDALSMIYNAVINWNSLSVSWQSFSLLVVLSCLAWTASYKILINLVFEKGFKYKQLILISFFLDNAERSCSKAAKKNKKRNNKKASSKSGETTSDSLSPEFMLTELKKCLEEAKLNKVM